MQMHCLLIVEVAKVTHISPGEFAFLAQQPSKMQDLVSSCKLRLFVPAENPSPTPPNPPPMFFSFSFGNYAPHPPSTRSRCFGQHRAHHGSKGECVTQHWPICAFDSPGLSDWLRDGHMTQVNPIRVCPWTLTETSINKAFLSFKFSELIRCRAKVAVGCHKRSLSKNEQMNKNEHS